VKYPRDHTIIVFVSGRFRAPSMWDIECNIRNAEHRSLELWRAGFVALCPHMNTHYFDGAAPDDIWLKGDLAMLARCDAMLVIDSGESSGVQAEIAFCHEKGIPVYYALKDLL